MTRYIATFSPQAWINDYAVSVDPEGETTWDATEYVKEQLREGVFRGNEVSQQFAKEWLEETLEHGDYDDILRTDPNAPQWIQDWHGPFDTYLEQVEE